MSLRPFFVGGARGASLLCLIASLVVLSACRPEIPEAYADAPGAAVEASSPVSPDHLGSAFRSSVWDDGRAEVLQYDGTRVLYGAPRPFVLSMIVVKEALNRETLVKSDAPDAAETIDVLKLHTVVDIPTPNYPYHYATSVFVDRANPFVVRKLTAATSEWCGITHRQLLRRGDTLVGSLHSYFEGETDGDVAIDMQGVVTEEQLLVAVRALDLSTEGSMPLRVLVRQADTHARAPRVRAGTLTMGPMSESEDATGARHDVRPVTFTWDGGTLRYDVEAAAPHRVIRHEASDGIRLVLRESRRWAYWEM
jgi:hypothetical protein